MFGEEPLIVAHRGASKGAPENTIPAFELAWERGADAIEGDFYLTKDGHVVCFHDTNTKRITGQTLLVIDSTLEELRKLDVGSHHSEIFKDTVMPTLAEILATIPAGRKIYIEIKCGADIVSYLLNDLEKSDLDQEQIIVISFKEDVIKTLAATAPYYKTYWLTSFKKDKSGQRSPSRDSILKTLKRIQADGISTGSAMVTQALIQDLQQQGYEYHVWTIDDPGAAQQFRQWGVQSITTNVPGKIRKHLASVAGNDESQ
jgi:glycerophosphoryl diester phosphodiesterase